MIRFLTLLLAAGLMAAGCGTQAPTVSIHEAARTGKLQLVQQHIKAGTDLNKKDSKGWTALHLAVAQGHDKVVEALAFGGADVNAAGPGNTTALSLATAKRQQRIIEILQAAATTTQVKKGGGGRALIDGGVGVSGVLESY